MAPPAGEFERLGPPEGDEQSPNRAATGDLLAVDHPERVRWLGRSEGVREVGGATVHAEALEAGLFTSRQTT